ncbi:hypothetical protein PWT90_00821 [Aphanocladium album]|nr:hypothetical protein PWT90_00821 [Aphanocladium album]
MAFRRTTDFEDVDYMSQAPRSSRGGGSDHVRVMERDREHDIYIDERRDRTPAFLREGGRRPEPGPMVLRRREVESFDRHHHSRSPTPPGMRIIEERIVRRARSESPPPREHSRTRIVETERTVSPQRRRRSPSPTVRFVERHVRERSPSEVDHEHIRIIERERGRSPERSPSPPPPPQVIKAPTIEREVITHYTDIDHGVIRARQPSPPPRHRTYDDVRETDIDIHLDKHHTDVDIRKTTRSRSRSRSRHRHYHDDELTIYDDSSRLRVDGGGGPRRARSMVSRSSEGDHIAGRMDAGGRMGEARGGATRDWGTIGVPPGTERVRMDGIGGGRTETTWSKYSGERRTKFSPGGGGGGGEVSILPVPILKNKHDSRSKERRLSVAVVDRDTEIDIERRRRHRSRSRPKVVAPRDTWTEVSRTLVSREAIERLGYPFEESKHYFYIMMFLPQEAVSELMDLSEDIRRSRRRVAHDRSREIELDIEIDRDIHHHHRPVQRRRQQCDGNEEGAPPAYIEACQSNSERLWKKISGEAHLPHNAEKARKLARQISVSTSWQYYRDLLQQQKQVTDNNLDIEALKYGLKRFPSLKRIVITPATHGYLFNPLYETPMIRNFGYALNYPIPRGWPTPLERYNRTTPLWEVAIRRDYYRGFTNIIQLLAEGQGSQVKELVIKTAQQPTGVSCEIFGAANTNYDHFCKMLGIPGFRRLDLALNIRTAWRSGYASLRNLQLFNALSSASDLESMHLFTNIEQNPHAADLEDGEGSMEHFIPLQNILPITAWPKLKHFGLSRFLVSQSDVVSFLKMLPASISTVELSFLYFLEGQGHYGRLLEQMRDELGWEQKQESARPKVMISVHDGGCFDWELSINVDREVQDFLYRLHGMG